MLAVILTLIKYSQGKGEKKFTEDGLYFFSPELLT